MSRWERWLSAVRHAFAVESVEPFTPEDLALLERLATLVVDRRMEAPIQFLLEAARPVAFLGTQAIRVLRPLAVQVYNPVELDRFYALLERRGTIDRLSRSWRRC